MIRRFFNTVVEHIVNQPEPIHYPSPFTKPETQSLHWLLATAPCFPVRVDSVSILTEPREFYDVILKGCREARYEGGIYWLGNQGGILGSASPSQVCTWGTGASNRRLWTVSAIIRNLRVGI